MLYEVITLVLAAAGAARAAVPPEGRTEDEGAPQRLESLLPRRCGVCHLDKAVITSYSIHYTKLYDPRHA